MTLSGEDTFYKEIFILELLLFTPSAPTISGEIPEWKNYITGILNVFSSQKQMTGQIPDDCMYEFQPFCLVLNSMKMTVLSDLVVGQIPG